MSAGSAHLEGVVGRDDESVHVGQLVILGEHLLLHLLTRQPTGSTDTELTQSSLPKSQVVL